MNLSIRSKTAFLATLHFMGSIGSAQLVHVNPDSNTFSPNGTSSEPWVLISSAAADANGDTVVIQGGTSEYGATTIDSPSTLTTSGAPVTIGKAPISQTNFRAIAYNVRLNDGPTTTGVDGWADGDRAEVIAGKYADWGTPDVIGFCEIWNHDPHWTEDLITFGDGNMLYSMSGFDLQGAFEHSGLAVKSAFQITDFARGVFTAAAGEDALASKGWLRGAVAKDGFDIFVIMTHLQADSLLSAELIQDYSARLLQMNQIRDAVNAIRVTWPHAVVILMGDFNVYGEDRAPSGSTVPNEYSGVMKPSLGPGIGRGMDVAKQVYPQWVDFTYTLGNSIVDNEVFGDDRPPFSNTARLDYIIAVDSADGKVIIRPTEFEVIKGMAVPAITADGHTDSNLSDHYGVAADFRIMRIAN